LQKEPRSRRGVDSEDEQILGILGNYSSLNLPLDLNAPEFRLGIQFDGEPVPEAKVARLNALVNGEQPAQVQGRGKRRQGQEGRRSR